MDNATLAVAPSVPPLPNYNDNLDETDDIMEDSTFSYDGYQVVRNEFFAHISEPSISFSNCRVTLNTACFRKLPDVNYIQFLVNPDTKKLVKEAKRKATVKSLSMMVC